MLLGALIFFAALSISRLATAQQQYAIPINLSGKQRMLSQRMAYLSTELLKSEDEVTQAAFKQELQSLVKQMRLHQQILEDGSDSLGVPPLAKVAGVQDSVPKLKKQLAAFLGHVEVILSAAPTDSLYLAEAAAAISQITQEASLLHSLDEAVSRYEGYATVQALRLERRTYALMGGILLVLTLEAFFVFRPMVNRLQQQKAVVEGQMGELQRKNQEIERLVYVASHDLQEPLRTVRSFGELLLEEQGKRLDEEGNYLLQRMVRATGRMQMLVRGLLEYSRVGAQEELQLVDLNQVLADLKEDLSQQIEETCAQIELAPLPVLWGYPLSLTQLFRNLLTNALKYQTPGKKPVVKISVQSSAQTWQFSVRDNGLGIAKEDLSKIFQIFYRPLQSMAYTGTGLGLAICKKVVEMHGGEISATAQLGEGTEFRFTINQPIAHELSH